MFSTKETITIVFFNDTTEINIITNKLDLLIIMLSIVKQTNQQNIIIILMFNFLMATKHLFDSYSNHYSRQIFTFIWIYTYSFQSEDYFNVHNCVQRQ